MLYRISLTVSYKTTLAALRYTTCRLALSHITETKVPSKMSISRRKQLWVTSKIKRLAQRSVFLVQRFSTTRNRTFRLEERKCIINLFNGDRRNPANYRIIYLTSVGSKLIEHILNSQIMKHFDQHNMSQVWNTHTLYDWTSVRRSRSCLINGSFLKRTAEQFYVGS